MTFAKPIAIESLKVHDMEMHPVWRIENNEDDDTFMIPVIDLPISKTGSILFTLQVELKNKEKVWAVIGNLRSDNVLATKTFINISLFHKNKRFNLARYFDADYNTRGPEALASFFGLLVDEVFPISYDISKYLLASEEITKGNIFKTPQNPLSYEERMKLILNR